jgi:aryl-alcohol dehydrogenase-like predicted oxidoreductase
MQARILARPSGAELPGCRTPAQVALQFARSCPGVATALCGMSHPGHVTENLELLGLPKAGPDELLALL